MDPNEPVPPVMRTELFEKLIMISPRRIDSLIQPLGLNRVSTSPVLPLAHAHLNLMRVTGRAFKVAHPSLAAAGRDQIRLAEHEMPGLMAMRMQLGASRPLAGARITGSVRMTVHTAALIQTLVELGADRRWASCNLFSTRMRRPRRWRSARTGRRTRRRVPVFAWKGETLAEYWWCTKQALTWPGDGPNVLLDDGGDATLLILKGWSPRTPARCPPPPGTVVSSTRC